MNDRSFRRGPFPEAHEDAKAAQRYLDSPQTRSPSYKLAFQDAEFILSDELRPVRLELELLKPELIQRGHDIESTVVIFGSARLPDPESARDRLEALRSEAQKNPSDPVMNRKLDVARRNLANSKYYDEARKLARIISTECQGPGRVTNVVITGGGPGIMEAANRGAHDVKAKSIGLNIVLHHEQAPNPYITPELCFQFHYFAVRKMHFLIRAKALVVFPGGFGTMDELFDALTLVQTQKMKTIPILLFGKKFWKKVIRFDIMLEEGFISPEDVELFNYVETAEEAWELLSRSDSINETNRA